jgi:hypothetical protein
MFSTWEWHTRKRKLKRWHIRENDFSSVIKEILIFFSGTEGILSTNLNV